MLQVTNLCTNLKLENYDLRAVDDISFTIEPGEVFGLIGESGCGKSITALSIMRLLPPQARFSAASQITLHGRNLLDITEREMRTIRGADIGMIFQDPMTCLNPVLTVGAQIAEVLTNHQHLKGRACYVEVLRLLDAVRIPDAVHRYSGYPHELSGGMKQRVMIAMALACKPSLLIADEPTTALDVTTQAQILGLIQDLQRQNNMAILLITHDLAVAAQMADKIAVMHAGKIVEQNSSDKFFAAPQDPYSRQLLGSLPSLFKVQQRSVELAPENILAVNDLQVYFPVKKGIFRKTVGYIKAVDGVNFNLIAGQTLALVGESGCGKTTIGKALLALIESTKGEVIFAGNNLLHLTQRKWRAIRADLQIVFQDPFAALNPKLRVIDSLEEGLIVQGKYKLKHQRVALIDKLLEQVGLLPEHKWRFPHEFSGGERQRLCIARALTVEPKIVVCDEPTSSLDVSVQSQVLHLLQQLQVEHNLTYLFITHDLAVISVLAQRVAVMYCGRIIESGLTADVLQNPKHPYTQMLLAAVPKIDKPKGSFAGVVTGEVPSILTPPSGCHFHPRCKFARPSCRSIYPPETQVSDTHMVKCVLYEQI